MIRDQAMQLSQYKQEKVKLDESIKLIADMCQAVKNQSNFFSKLRFLDIELPDHGSYHVDE